MWISTSTSFQVKLVKLPELRKTGLGRPLNEKKKKSIWRNRFVCWIFAKFEDYLLDIFRIRKLSLILHLFSTLYSIWGGEYCYLKQLITYIWRHRWLYIHSLYILPHRVVKLHSKTLSIDSIRVCVASLDMYRFALSIFYHLSDRLIPCECIPSLTGQLLYKCTLCMVLHLL